jgi:hypothetical protein
VNGNSKTLLPNGSSMDEIANKLIEKFMGLFKSILEPVSSPYSNEVLAGQINDIGILLYILSILICILIMALLFNIVIVLNSERILNFFTNKYIKWYVNFNLKIIGLEVMFLGSSILYFMYYLSEGIRYIAIHPITFN